MAQMATALTLRESLAALTGDAASALLLNQVIMRRGRQISMKGFAMPWRRQTTGRLFDGLAESPWMTASRRRAGKKWTTVATIDVPCLDAALAELGYRRRTLEDPGLAVGRRIVISPEEVEAAGGWKAAVALHAASQLEADGMKATAAALAEYLAGTYRLDVSERTARRYLSERERTKTPTQKGQKRPPKKDKNDRPKTTGQKRPAKNDRSKRTKTPTQKRTKTTTNRLSTHSRFAPMLKTETTHCMSVCDTSAQAREAQVREERNKQTDSDADSDFKKVEEGESAEILDVSDVDVVLDASDVEKYASMLRPHFCAEAEAVAEAALLADREHLLSMFDELRPGWAGIDRRHTARALHKDARSARAWLSWLLAEYERAGRPAAKGGRCDLPASSTLPEGGPRLLALMRRCRSTTYAACLAEAAVMSAETEGLDLRGRIRPLLDAARAGAGESDELRRAAQDVALSIAAENLGVPAAVEYCMSIFTVDEAAALVDRARSTRPPAESRDIPVLRAKAAWPAGAVPGDPGDAEPVPAAAEPARDASGPCSSLSGLHQYEQGVCRRCGARLRAENAAQATAIDA